MRLYHGSANFEDIAKEGLSPNPDVETDFGDGRRLKSCGGVYMSDRITMAAFYANMSTNSEMSLGGDPCVFAVDIEPNLLIADEDKVWFPFKRVIERLSRSRLEEGFDMDEAEAFIVDNLGDLTRAATEIAQVFHLDTASPQTMSLIKEAIRAFIVKDICYEWNPDHEHTAEVGTINRFCEIARIALDPQWLARNFDGDYGFTCRTLSHIPSRGDGDAVITGSIRLQMSSDGLSVIAVDIDGVFTVDDAVEFQEAFITRAWDANFIEIEEFDIRQHHLMPG